MELIFFQVSGGFHIAPGESFSINHVHGKEISIVLLHWCICHWLMVILEYQPSFSKNKNPLNWEFR